MTGKNPEYEAKGYEGRVNEREAPASVDRDRWEEVSRSKETVKRLGGEDVSSSGEKPVSSHAGQEPVRSPDTISAYRAREPRTESHETVDTINAYRSTEPSADSPYWTVSEEDS